MPVIFLAALLPHIASAAVTSSVSVSVYCYNTTLVLTTDDTSYQFTETANMTVLINNAQNANDLNEMLLIELYNPAGNRVAYMALDNATAPGNGTNTTSYYRNLSDISTGNYTLRARLIPTFAYPVQNATAHDCSLAGLPIQSDVNITVTQLRPNAPQNLRLILNTTSNDTTLNWTLSTSPNVVNYVIYLTDSWPAGFNFSKPYLIVSNSTTNWTDPTSDGVNERYYIVRANNTLGLTDENTYAVAKWNLKLYSGWNLISIPLLPWNESMDDIFYTAEDSDISNRWSATGQTFQRTDYFGGFGWSGDYVTMQPDRGYWYYSQKAGYGTTPFNNTIVGAVPQAQRSETIYNLTWSMLGWTSVNTKSLDNVLDGASDLDLMNYYDAVLDTFKRTDYFLGFGWFGDFNNIVPGRGYWYYSQNDTQYSWAYQP